MALSPLRSGQRAARSAIDGMFGMGYYDDDVALKRTFPIYREWNVAIEVDMSNMTNHVVLAGPGSLSVSNTDQAAGNFAVVSKIANYPRDVQGSLRINW